MQTTLNVSEFRANMLFYLNKANSGTTFTITTNGKAIATLSSPPNTKAEWLSKLEQIAEQAEVYDVISPIDADWDATK